MSKRTLAIVENILCAIIGLAALVAAGYLLGGLL